MYMYICAHTISTQVDMEETYTEQVVDAKNATIAALRMGFAEVAMSKLFTPGVDSTHRVPYGHNSVRILPLSKSSVEYDRITKLFSVSNVRHRDPKSSRANPTWFPMVDSDITNIDKIINPHLATRYAAAVVRMAPSTTCKTTDASYCPIAGYEVESFPDVDPSRSRNELFVWHGD